MVEGFCPLSRKVFHWGVSLELTFFLPLQKEKRKKLPN